MPTHELPVILVTRRMEEDLHAAETLFFPEVMALHARPDRLKEILKSLATKILADLPPLEIHRRMPAAIPDLSSIEIALSPVKSTAAWSQPINLRFDILRWRHGDEAAIAYVPALGIEIVAGREEQLDGLIEKHIRAALARTKTAEKLFDLVQLGRMQQIVVERDTLTVEIKTPAQIAADESKEAAAKPVIEEAGMILEEWRVSPAYELDEMIAKLAEALAGAQGRSVLLVGPTGVGKTALFGQLFRQRSQFHFASAPFWATSGARLIAGMSGYGLWQERCQKLCKQAKAAGAFLHLGNLIELMEVGKGGGSQLGIANFFRPYLSRGDVWAVAECTAEQLPIIEKASPQLLAAFTVLRMEEPTLEAGRAILRRVAMDLSKQRGQSGASITDAALDRLDRLHRRYATYSASPGRPLRFLKNLLRPTAPSPHLPITPSEVTAAFSRETGLPLLLLDEALPLDLAAAREHFESRVIGQPAAVERVVDLLATVKAALNRPKRPIASLLFIGPTGVGKTEMAKAIAEYFFGQAGGGRLVRFDMSEFATPGAVSRLVGTAWEAQGLLTSKVREQPFCVLLFDEFEKAHPAFFDLLLQVLGEGRLTDSAGRLADFSNAIIVMTSNLGAAAFGAGPFGLSRSKPGGDAGEHFTDAVREFLRPELFNRIDRVVPFGPLDEATIRRIAAREIDLIARRDGVLRRNLHLSVSPAALDELARGGYEPLYGARPLKRKIEQDLLAPLADAANQYSAALPLDAGVEVIDGQVQVTVRARRTDTAKSEGVMHATTLTFFTNKAIELRRRAQAIARCPAALSVANELFTLQRFIARRTAKAKTTGRQLIDPIQRERLKLLESLTQQITALLSGGIAIEEGLLLHQYEASPLPMNTGQLERSLDALAADARAIMLRLFTLNQPTPHAISLGLFGNSAAALFSLARAYRDVAMATGNAEIPASCAGWYYARAGRGGLAPLAIAANEVETFLNEPRAGVQGILLSIRAPFAQARFEAEAGLHVIEEERNKNSQPILVDASTARTYQPPPDVEFGIALAGQRRRTYTTLREEADDTATGRTYRWTGRSFAPALEAAIQENLDRRLEGILSEEKKSAASE